LEGDLSESERSSLDNALADDPTLRETLQELESVVSALRSLPEPELPPAFATRVMAAVQEQAEAPRGVRAWIQRIFEPVVAVPLAAGITALALVIGASQGSVSPGEPADAMVLADATPTGEPEPAVPVPSLRPGEPGAPSELVTAPPPTIFIQGPTPAEVRRWTEETLFARDLHRRLHGLHPHAPSLASQIIQTEEQGLQIVNFEGRRPRARR
jgi:hypothetical protein